MKRGWLYAFLPFHDHESWRHPWHHSYPCYHYFSNSTCTHSAYFWRRQHAGLRGIWGRSVWKWGFSDPLKCDFSNLILWKAEYSMDLSQLLYRHLLWDPTLCLFSMKIKGPGHMIILHIFVSFCHNFSFIYEK